MHLKSLLVVACVTHLVLGQQTQNNVVRCKVALNFRDECECPFNTNTGAVQVPSEHGCIDKAYACYCTTCCQDFNVASKYDDFVPLPVASQHLANRTAAYNPRYRGITSLGCDLSLAWNYQDPVETGFEQVQSLNNTCDVAGYFAGPQGLYTAVTEDSHGVENTGPTDPLTLCFHEQPSFSGYLLVANTSIPDTIQSTSLTLAAPIPDTVNNYNSSLNLVPTAVTINDAAIPTLNASSPFWQNTWYDSTPGAPQRCVGLITQCSAGANVWRLCRTGGYGQADASVQATLLFDATAPSSAASASAASVLQVFATMFFIQFFMTCLHCM